MIPRLMVAFIVIALFNSASATGRLALTVNDIPASTTDKLVVVIDGAVNARIELNYGGSGALLHTADLPSGSGVRVRVIAARQAHDFLGTLYVVAGARLDSLDINDGKTTEVELSLLPFLWSVDSSTPSVVEIGTEFIISGGISDPADYLEDSFPFSGLIWDTSPFGSNNGANNSVFSLSVIKTAPGQYEFSTLFTAPLVAGSIFYQLLFVGLPFQDSVLTPVNLAAPDLGAGEIALTTRIITDFDGDGVSDDQDNCPNTPNVNQLDTDFDGNGNVCDSDDDNDGMPDAYELDNGFDPLNAADADQDADGDGYSNRFEFKAGTDPQDPKSKPANALPWLPLLLSEQQID